MLERLVDANLFTVPVDSRHTWYRYHPLFADLLRQRLQSTQADCLHELHHRASVWYEDNARIDLAIEYALAVQDGERAARLIGQVAEDLLKRGEARIVLRWLEAIPEGTLLASPFLVSLYGFALILCGRSTQTASLLLEKMEDSGVQDEFQGEIAMLQAFLAIMHGDAPRTIQLSERALQYLGDKRAFFRSLAADTLGMGYTLVGDIPAATRAFQQVVDISSQSNNVMMTVMALTNLAGLQYFHGQLQTAKTTCGQVLALAAERFGPGSPMIGKTMLNLAEIHREQGDLATAERYFREAARLMENFVEIGLPIAYISLARLKVDQKDWSAAQDMVDQARRLAQATRSIMMDDQLVEITQVRLWIAQGELAQATQWAKQRGLLERSPDELLAAPGRNVALNELFEAEILTLIRLQMALGQPVLAAALIDGLIQTNERQGYERRRVELMALKAMALHRMGRIDQARDALEQALRMGEPEGYHNTFVEHGEPMAQLLYQAVERHICPAYAGRLLRAIAEACPGPSPADVREYEMIEPLSDREREVLALIAEGLTNGEIARRLYISLSTVKGHTTHIFGKLNVGNRTQAVARARSLGLLPHA
jgi:LuxR family maltose regulon positive regulatory protein